MPYWAREMRRFARPGRGRHDLGGLCGHGAGTSRDLTARSTALTRSANSADAKTASAQFCWRCGELIRQGLPLTEADGKTERTPHLAEAHPLRLIGVLQMDQRAKVRTRPRPRRRAGSASRRAPGVWHWRRRQALQPLRTAAGSACAALHCRMMRARRPLLRYLRIQGIWGMCLGRLSRPSRKRGLAALGAFSLCSWPSQAMTQSKVDSDVTHTFLNAWDADTLQAVRGFVMLLTKCA
ncbi:unnamed protein product [Effrenium voratum]|nr:unnamed protein product [Effrenium voratum]